MADTQIGGTIGGRYNVIDKPAEGGMSVVWLVRDSRLEKLWAIKEIKKNASDATHRVDVDLMRKEANIMKNLDHPNIVHVVDIIEESGALYVVMDYVPGKDLAKTMRENRAALGTGVYAYPQADVIDWGIQLCDALGYLHSQNPPVIYRDMKPGNVMLQDDGSVKIIDFGIAREFKSNQSLDTRPLGTRGYASPEAAEKVSQTDARSDVYSLGVTLFHLVTGHSPMEYITQPNLPPIRQLDPSLSPALEASIIRATQWDPNARQQSMNELRYELENPQEPEAVVRMRRTLSLFRSFAIASAVCLALGIGSLVGSRLVRSSSYDGLVKRAAVASRVENGGQPSDAERLYTEAIEIVPNDLEPYSALINEVYKDDSEFTTSEASRWNALFEANRASIENDEGYAKLCYDVGIDYFIYFGYGDDLTKSSQAVGWFDRAINAYDERNGNCTLSESQRRTAETYKTIGEFAQRIQRAQAEANESETYAEYWAALQNAVTAAGEGAGDETIVQLRLYDTVFNALNSPVYLQGFRRGGVSEAQVISLYNQVLQQTQNLQGAAVGSALTEELYATIMNSASNVQRNIENVFGSVGASLSATSQTTTSASTSSTEGEGQS